MVNNEKLGHTFSLSKLLLRKLEKIYLYAREGTDPVRSQAREIQDL